MSGLSNFKRVARNSGEFVGANDIAITLINNGAAVVLRAEDKELAAIANIKKSECIDDCLKPILEKILLSSYRSEKIVNATIISNAGLNLIEDIEDYLFRNKINIDEIKTHENTFLLTYSIKNGIKLYEKK